MMKDFETLLEEITKNPASSTIGEKVPITLQEQERERQEQQKELIKTISSSQDSRQKTLQWLLDRIPNNDDDELEPPSGDGETSTSIGSKCIELFATLCEKSDGFEAAVASAGVSAFVALEGWLQRDTGSEAVRKRVRKALERIRRGDISDDNDIDGEDMDDGNDMPTTVQTPLKPVLNLTRVDGIGLWHSWTRNFKSPLLALLDLLDNAFDACFANHVQNYNHDLFSSLVTNTGFDGKIHILPDLAEQKGPVNSKNKPLATGLVIVNNSCRKIKQLQKILQVYSSEKGKGSESIGENGVGLKQGCATLSDLSFVLLRNKSKLSLGIIAKPLQRPEGCYLPDFEFDEDLNDLHSAMEKLFQDEPAVGDCVASYGGGDLQLGIRRLCARFEEMSNPETWGDHDHVFCIILDKIRHGSQLEVKKEDNHEQNNNNNSDDEMTANDNNNPQYHKLTQEEEYHKRTHSLMQELRAELPRQYIHIPDTFDVTVGEHRVQFNYWQRRLVELSKFEQIIDTEHPWYSASDWKNPNTGYVIRIFAGFDPIRSGMKSGSPCSLFVYSRQSGRLIKHHVDARGLLDFSCGGTMFSQGLTLIVDDYRGHLPLNPTKQDVAFSEQANGETNRRNLFAWIGAVGHAFYTYHLEKYLRRKGDLSIAIAKFWTKAQRLSQNDNDINDKIVIRQLSDSKFTTFPGIQWKNSQGRIRSNCITTTEVTGKDTRFRLEVPSNTPNVTSSNTRKGRKKKRVSSVKSNSRAKVKVTPQVISSSFVDDSESLEEDDEEESGFSEEEEVEAALEGKKVSPRSAVTRRRKRKLGEIPKTVGEYKLKCDSLTKRVKSMQAENSKLLLEIEALKLAQTQLTESLEYERRMNRASEREKKNLKNQVHLLEKRLDSSDELSSENTKTSPVHKEEPSSPQNGNDRHSRALSDQVFSLEKGDETKVDDEDDDPVVIDIF